MTAITVYVKLKGDDDEKVIAATGAVDNGFTLVVEDVNEVVASFELHDVEHWYWEPRVVITEKIRTVLYVYRCSSCGHRGDQRLADDSRDGEASTCATCGVPVTLEWDGGVTLATPKSIADEAIARARGRK